MTKEDLNKDNLIKLGGRYWENYGKERVYLTDEVLQNLGFSLVEKDKTQTMFVNEFRSIDTVKNSFVYYDCKSNNIHASEGRIRVLFFSNVGIKCLK